MHTIEVCGVDRDEDLVADPVPVLQAKLVFSVKGADEVRDNGGRFGDGPGAILCACDEEGGFAVMACSNEAWWGAVGGGGVIRRVSLVGDQVVVDVELFEEPEDTLGLGALGVAG